MQQFQLVLCVGAVFHVRWHPFEAALYAADLDDVCQGAPATGDGTAFSAMLARMRQC